MIKIRYILLLVLASVLSASCSQYSKLLESSDYEKQYSEALRYFDAGKTSKALSLLVNVENIYSAKDRIDTIKFYIASSCFDRGDFQTSAELFNVFRKEYGRSSFIEDAEYLYAMSYYNLAPNSELDQSYAIKAQEAFKEFSYRYPNSERKLKADNYIQELAERRHKKDFYVGETYYKISYHTSAISTLKNILKRDPDTPLREEILFLILKSQYAFAKESIKEKQRDRFYDVVDGYYSLLSEYPKTKYSKIAKRMFDNAQDIIKGNAVVNDDSYDIIRVHDKEYKKKLKLEDKILRESEKGDKRNNAKLVKMAHELQKVEEELRRLENINNDEEVDVNKTEKKSSKSSKGKRNSEESDSTNETEK